jgi:hypothetical protein
VTVAADKTTKQLDAILTSVNSEVSRIKKQVAQAEKLLSRHSELIGLEEKEALLGELRNQSQLTQAITGLVNQLNLDKHHFQPSAYTEELAWREAAQDAHARQMFARRMEVDSNIASIRKLSALKRKKAAKVCSCGLHHSIVFLDQEGVVVQEMCPKEWWVKTCRLAFEDGVLGEHTKNFPLSRITKEYGWNN